MAKEYRTDAPTLKRARDLRREMTEAEKKLWHHIRADQLEGNRFRRQVPEKPYILDFCCLKKRLVIEVDGGQHADNNADVQRTRWLERKGYQVLRFWNNEVLSNIEGVLAVIAEKLRSMPNRF
ncbi:endonuclease domain-containing protein [Dongia sp.]|uniref:endonuclease domain-containing protein n=1 Tax=Dongia sp. TaxID=1977262 RepID=UPI003752DB82